MASRRHQAQGYRDVDLKELRAALERARTAPMSAEDHALLAGAVDTFTAMTRDLNPAQRRGR